MSAKKTATNPQKCNCEIHKIGKLDPQNYPLYCILAAHQAVLLTATETELIMSLACA